MDTFSKHCGFHGIVSHWESKVEASFYSMLTWYHFH